MNAIEIRGLRKRYGQREVLHGIDFQVGQGKLVGFLGPNGAGKTTTVRILLGLIAPTAGVTKVFGQPAGRMGWQLRADIGYLPGEVRFYSHLSGRANLRFLANARRKSCDAEIQRLASLFKLELDKTVRKYSSGMKQKLGLIQALMHRPQLLVLDEPTSGLDPLVRKTLFEELHSIVHSQGRTILFSSHTLSEVEELCDEVIILRDGHVVEQKGLEAFRRQGLRRVQLFFEPNVQHPEEFPAAFTKISANETSITGTWSGSTQSLLSWLNQQPIADLVVEPPNLEDLFLTYYTEESGH